MNYTPWNPLIDTPLPPCPDCAALRQQLADVQEQNAKLRDALTDIAAANLDDWDIQDAVRNTLQEAQ